LLSWLTVVDDGDENDRGSKEIISERDIVVINTNDNNSNDIIKTKSFNISSSTRVTVPIIPNVIVNTSQNNTSYSSSASVPEKIASYVDIQMKNIQDNIQLNGNINTNNSTNVTFQPFQMNNAKKFNINHNYGISRLWKGQSSGIIFQTFLEFTDAKQYCDLYAELYSDRTPTETYQVHNLKNGNDVVYYKRTDEYFLALEKKLRNNDSNNINNTNA